VSRPPRNMRAFTRIKPRDRPPLPLPGGTASQAASRSSPGPAASRHDHCLTGDKAAGLTLAAVMMEGSAEVHNDPGPALMLVAMVMVLVAVMMLALSSVPLVPLLL